LQVQGLLYLRGQVLRTVAGMVGVVTTVLAGSTIGLLVAVASGHSLALSLAAAIPAAVAMLVALLLYAHRLWLHSGSAPLGADAA
jgi:hypothetical protein